MRKILFLLIYFFITISLFSNPFELSDNSDIAEFNLSKSDIRVDGNNIIEFYVIGKIKSGWYIYANDKGPGTGKPFHINFETPNIKILKIEYPKGTRKDILELNEWVNVYKENFEVKIILQILQPINKIDLFIEALTCNKSCVPINKTLTINLVYENFENVLSSTSKDKINLISKNKSVFLSNNSSLKKLESFKIINKLDKKFNFYNLIFYSIIGLISGILLNFMPCVLPVLGIKVLSVINTVSERKNAVILGLFYSLGILSMFTVLAATLAFFNLQWGEHFSNPWFIISMIILVVFFSLGLFDLFFINVTLNSQGKLKNKYISAFVQGIFMTILATPCAGPGLGATIGWVSLQPAIIIFVIYFFIGVGMALPYLLLVSVPQLNKFLPKAGSWMIKFKEFMAFILLLTVIYLFSVLNQKYHLIALTAIFLTCFSVWYWNRFILLKKISIRKLLEILFIVTIFFGGIYFSKKIFLVDFNVENVSNLWKKYEKTFFLNELEKGNNILIDFSADWCTNCKINEKLVLNDPEILSIFYKYRVTLFKADKTLENLAADELMKKFNVKSVPTVILFNPETKKIIIMRDLLIKSVFKSKLIKFFG